MNTSQIAIAWSGGNALVSSGMLLLKVTLLLALAFAACRLATRSVRNAHDVWAGVLLSLLVFPALSVFMPKVSLPWALAHNVMTHASVLARTRAGELLTSVWLTGALVTLATLLTHLLHLRSLRVSAERITEPAWLELSADIGRELQLSRSVTLLRAQAPVVPMTWGILHPVILLPALADGWPHARRRAVLLHELTHVTRRDFLVELLAWSACVVYWFHPAVWRAAALLRVERELACDQAVLRAGTRPSDYAEHLLDIMRALTGARRAAIASTMVSRTHIEARLHAILTLPPSPTHSRSGRILLVAVAICVLAAATLTPNNDGLTGRCAAHHVMPPAGHFFCPIC